MKNKRMEKRLNFYIPYELEKKLREFTKEKGWKMSFVIREAIKKYLDQEK